MKHHVFSEIQTAAHVLTLKQSDIVPFLRKCVRERSLSALVKQLNDDLAFGTPEQQQQANRALLHIGFI